MKRILILLFLVLMPFYIFAEEGEFQFAMGGGLYIPFEQHTDDKTVYMYCSYNIPVSLFFGITDNFDLGVYGSFTSLDNTNTKMEYDGLNGKEYFDYKHFNFALQARYNLFPGFLGFNDIHIIAGIGDSIETYKNREFYVSNKLYENYSNSDYTEGGLIFQGGIDFTSNFWWIFLFRAETLYNVDLDGDSFMEVNFYLGISWMLQSYGGR